MASAERARDILRKAGIDVNSAANGVWLRGRQLGVQTESFGSHLGIHTPQYVERLTRILEQAEREGRIVQALTDIGDFLRNGGQLH
jgi:pyruvate/2-oxoglutarate dehydrogenase complex dihydrolipoamide acyltransferase (E2) component